MMVSKWPLAAMAQHQTSDSDHPAIDWLQLIRHPEYSHTLANLLSQQDSFRLQKQVKLVGLCCKQSCYKRFTWSSLWMWTSGACNQDTGAIAERGEAGSNQSGQVSQSQKMRGPLWQTRDRDASIPGLHSMNPASQSFWQLQDGLPSPPTHSHSSLCSKGKVMN